jgi:CRISPR-associated protein Cas1
MPYRNLLIAGAARLSCKNGQLVVEGTQTLSFPMENISAVLLENRQSSITVAALSALAQNGATVYLCDEKHLPCAVQLPFAAHSRQLEVMRAQQEMTQAACDRLWKQIVCAKIGNQAECLSLCGKEKEAIFLRARVRMVMTGDKSNVEATAAAFYFPTLFGEDFTRGDELDGRNAALNYGYAILRGYMARCIAVYGLAPWQGVHHCSGVNSFNLADDMMEPYRPVVDLFTATNVDAECELTPHLKARLLDLLNADILSGNQHHSVAYAMERQVQSLRSCCDKQKDALLLPGLLATQQHRYE